ncbi:DUF998 domain-containing protein [Prauserella muralis]|uniref:Uncharacterized protein n=1 Tax=Prauserella muralis TaxID=588067 RepID=A0A2V4B9J9_9PSEU|nr:DUF998 domain-containing protein [Prauserella muralis]PXY31948.1 hypothetical protein BAY60_06380 [Prauserella muralis]TWE13626.1 uncharacterized protein DUF998 [Prauserella muralis]
MADLGTKAKAATARTVRTLPVARTRVWTIAASAALGWALFTLLILHVVSSFNPLVDPLSRYAFTDNGEGMLEASLLSFAVGVIAVRGALAASGFPVTRTTTVLTGATALGLAAAALFPATFTAEIDPASGLIHQYASVLAFAALPAIAFSVLDGLRHVPELAAARTMFVRLLQLCALSLTLFAVSYVADALPSTPLLNTVVSLLPVGFAQRIVFVVDFCLLAAVLVLAVRTARLHGARCR